MIVISLIVGSAAFCAGIVGEGVDSWLACAAGGVLVADAIERISITYYRRARS